MKKPNHYILNLKDNSNVTTYYIVTIKYTEKLKLYIRAIKLADSDELLNTFPDSIKEIKKQIIKHVPISKLGILERKAFKDYINYLTTIWS